MSSAISLHPVLTYDLMQKLGFQVTDYYFEYDLESQARSLITESIIGQEHVQSRLYLKDDSAIWNCDSHNLRFTRQINIGNPSYLFGPGGVAGMNAEIGLAVIWTSKQSSQRGVIVGESITANSEKRMFAVQGEFSPGVLREQFSLTTILYLKNAGMLVAGESYFARLSGTCLGELGDTTIHLKGNGSFFPIFSQREEGPLWRVECRWEDPKSDTFDAENVRIILNEKHSDYKYTQSPDGKILTPLMKEIISSSIQIIIESAMRDVSIEDIMSGKEIDRGSVCMAIQYFIQTFDLDSSSKEGLAYSLRHYLDRKMGGIA